MKKLPILLYFTPLCLIPAIGSGSAKCYHERYDLDEDGDIDIVDIMLVVKH